MVISDDLRAVMHRAMVGFGKTTGNMLCSQRRSWLMASDRK